MNNLQKHINDYLNHCRHHKMLDSKTTKAYKIDLTQFYNYTNDVDVTTISPSMLEEYISKLHCTYKPKTVKRKIASLKSFFHYLEFRDYIVNNPLKNALRDVAALELLFATGIRISELCSLKMNDINLYDRTVLIYGKGSKERKLQIGNDDVVAILQKYKDAYLPDIQKTNYFFVNQSGAPLSDQAVRRAINKYSSIAAIEMHITPHMFRHTFATSLLEADVDIRYIQEMLGHSSINVTEIYTHVAMAKQRDILTTKHPRKNFNL